MCRLDEHEECFVRGRCNCTCHTKFVVRDYRYPDETYLIDDLSYLIWAAALPSKLENRAEFFDRIIKKTYATESLTPDGVRIQYSIQKAEALKKALFSMMDEMVNIYSREKFWQLLSNHIDLNEFVGYRPEQIM